MPEFVRVFQVQGMDSNAEPRYQVVPTGQSRWIALRAGAGLSLSIDDPTVCTVREISLGNLPADDRAHGALPSDRYFILEGKRKGTTFLSGAAKGGLTNVALEVAVKDSIQQLILFHFLVDSTGRRSRRPAADIGHWMPRLNYIWTRQANVAFKNHGVKETQIASDLGDTIKIPGHQIGAVGQSIADLGNQQVGINVFFVWALQDSTRPGVGPRRVDH